jgi:drug/metabolite transporter (DMT)-like permease
MSPSRWQIGIVLAIGIIGVSLAAIWIRLASSAVTFENKVGFSLFLAASRLILAALIVLPTAKNLKFTHNNLQSYYYAIAAGICLASHFATWITSLSFTSIAASTVLVTTNPIWVGFFSWWWYGEKFSQLKLLGIGVALVGGTIIALADINVVGSNYDNPILGNILALIGAVMSSLYIIFGLQAQRQGLNTSNYVAIAYSIAALFLLPLPFFYDTSYFGYPPAVYLYIFLMALISQVIGHTSFNWSVRWISPTLISLSLLFEPVVASVMGGIIFAEIPSLGLLLGGLIILLGITLFLLKATSSN